MSLVLVARDDVVMMKALDEGDGRQERRFSFTDDDP